MQNARKASKGMCLAVAAFFLCPGGPVVMAATPEAPETIVQRAELYEAMAARAGDEAAYRGSLQKLLNRSEVRRVAERAGLDLKRVQAAVAVLSGEELRVAAGQAQRVEEALAGGSSIVITSTMLIIGLLVLIILLVV